MYWCRGCVRVYHTGVPQYTCCAMIVCWFRWLSHLTYPTYRSCELRQRYCTLIYTAPVYWCRGCVRVYHTGVPQYTCCAMIVCWFRWLSHLTYPTYRSCELRQRYCTLTYTAPVYWCRGCVRVYHTSVPQYTCCVVMVCWFRWLSHLTYPTHRAMYLM